MPDQASSRPRYPDRPQLPDAPYLLGIQIAGIAIDDDNIHALARTALTEQLDTIAQDPEPDYGFIDLDGGVCGQPVRWAQSWGSWDRHNRILATRHDICPECRWRVALELGTTELLLTSLIPASHDGVEGAALDRAYGGHATLVYRICQKIMADTYGRDGDTGLALQLLVHATRHRLIPLTWDEGCGDGSCEHDSLADCYTGSACCRACTVHAGPWSGEWEGQSVAQCTVPGPCSVLTTLADTYEVRVGGGRP